MTKIKYCGLTRKQDIEKANELMVDYVGFVFAKKSRRYVSAEQARELKSFLHPEILTTGVFVNASQEEILYLLENEIIDVVQLHGTETDEYLGELRKKTDHTIVQAFRIDSAADVERANASLADYVLVDSGNGGTGTTFDWSLLTKMKRPYFLAGGLNTENIEEALEVLDPFAVDVSSGIETDGWKDPEKMELFASRVRKSENN